MKNEAILSNPALRPFNKTNEADSNKDVIAQFLADPESGIELTEKQKDLLTRWEFADEKIRQGMGRLNRQRIAELVRDHFGISINTAKADLVAAEEVFSSSNPLNKRHRIQLRVEFLEKQSRLASKIGDYKAVAGIEKSISFYLDRYPETITAKPKRTVVYNLQVNNFNEATIPEEEAEAIIMDELSRIELEEADD